jgi:hypothetical protein
LDKKTYYVTVDVGPQTGQIRDEISLNDAVYDFEIQATPEEINQLQQLFEDTQDADLKTFIKAHIPFQTLEREKESWNEDDKIDAVYQMIYNLGTVKTKQKMEQSGLILRT